ncbi:alpha/beta fold hydrolase [Serinibacter salmoneus]|nr:alpha/beta hydrolase [Serinibacter salmoneus]
MSTHTPRPIDVPVPGGALRVIVWEPSPPAAPGGPTPTVLLVHGVTSSHLAWVDVVAALPGVRLIAPDLRGRGRSRDVAGPAGMVRHADDLAAVLDHLGIDALPVVGHSMGAFVSVVLAARHPARVRSLTLVDGGLPLPIPAGLTPDQVVDAVLGPTAQRLSRRFASRETYLDFWRDHPAFAADWSATIEDYFAYDLVPDGEAFRPATSYETTAADTIDLTTGQTLPAALAALADLGIPAHLITVPRGLQDEPPGLYPADGLTELLAAYPWLTHERIETRNHYTIVMSPAGARLVAGAIPLPETQPGTQPGTQPDQEAAR